MKKKVLLIMDNHESHVTIEAINLAKESGIILFTFPPHTSHKLQPLDRGVFGPFKKLYNQAASNWLQGHPGKPITIYDVGELVGTAYPRAFTPLNIQSGFRATGIFPVNQNIFTEDEFLCSNVTDREPPQREISDQELAIPGPSSASVSAAEVVTLATSSKGEMSGEFKSPEQIRPYPKAGLRSVSARGRRKPGRCRILTDTPEKIEIEEDNAKRQAKKICVKKATRKVLQSSSSEEETEEAMVSRSSSGEDVEWPPQRETEENEGVEIHKGDFWLTKLEGKKKIHFYIGEVVDINEEEYVIKYLKKIPGADNKFLFPEEAKTYSILEKDFIMKLPSPVSIGGSARKALQLSFCVNFGSYQVE